MRKYIIHDKERTTENAASWWKSERMGYTIDVYDAGIYSELEARQIVQSGMGMEQAFSIGRLIRLNLLKPAIGPNELPEPDITYETPNYGR